MVESRFVGQRTFEGIMETLGVNAFLGAKLFDESWIVRLNQPWSLWELAINLGTTINVDRRQL